MPFVYMITNSINRKRYVGKANNIEARWNAHLRAARRGEDGRLYRAIRKYGENAFSVCMLSEEEDAYRGEREWIILLREAGFDLYNLNDGGIGGINPSAETLEKHRLAKIGKIFSDEHRENIRIAARNRPPVSEETKQKLREARAKRITSDVTRAKMSQAMTGRKLSDETRQKISNFMKKEWNRRFNLIRVD